MYHSHAHQYDSILGPSPYPWRMLWI